MRIYQEPVVRGLQLQEKIEEVIDLLKNILGLSLRRASKITSISYGNAQKIAKEIMGLHPYKLEMLHKLKDPDFQNRINFANWL